MKKTLVALAALAATGAFAQVTLYGKVDAFLGNVTQTTGGNDTATGNPGLVVNSAGLSGSRWGLKGSEDLGGGSSVSFQLENGFNVDAGSAAQGGLLFGRQAYISYNASFGSVAAGRQYTPLDTVWGTYDAQGYSSTSAMGYAWNKGSSLDIGRGNNVLSYTSPKLGGSTTVVVAWAPGEDRDTTINRSGSDHASAAVMYAGGALNVGGAYETQRATTAATDVTTNSWALGGTLNLGVVTLAAGVEQASTSTTVDRGWQIGVNYPMSAATSLAVSYAREATATTGLNVDGVASAWGMQLVQQLSKRTNVYGTYLRGSSTNAVATGAAQPETVNTTVGVGIRHDF